MTRGVSGDSSVEQLLYLFFIGPAHLKILKAAYFTNAAKSIWEESSEAHFGIYIVKLYLSKSLKQVKV